MGTVPQPPQAELSHLSLERTQEAELRARHGEKVRPRDVMLAKLHTGKKWFDSGEYFLAKEGKQPSDMMPGGQPADSLPPKLAPSAPSQKGRLTATVPPIHEDEQMRGGEPSVSDY